MLKPIRTERQHESALAKAYGLMQKPLRAGSKESDELEVLSMLIERYEEVHYPIAPPHPIEAIRFRMEQLGMKPSELKMVLGYRSRSSEILRGKRKLTLEMIRRLHEKLQIPLESLVSRY
ncbi:MAG TPA: transcriptional regulator [Candidatus Kapabacteria bacterium]|nr:transcriptional regulator [Candidatus Kapabacteria bacterium]